MDEKQLSKKESQLRLKELKLSGTIKKEIYQCLD